MTWGDSIRDRIFLIRGSPKDLVAREKSKLSNVLINICCGAAELDAWHPRLRIAPEPTNGTLVLAKHDGNWAMESSGFNRWNSTPMTLKKAAGRPLIVVGGIGDVEATDQLASDVIYAASMGSTVLIETIGGQGNFTMKLRTQIASKAGVILEPSKSIPPLQGRRGWSIHHNQNIDPPLIAQIDKGSVVFVACDIRNALLGEPSWGIHGYNQKSAQLLVTYLMNQGN